MGSFDSHPIILHPHLQSARHGLKRNFYLTVAGVLLHVAQALLKHPIDSHLRQRMQRHGYFTPETCPDSHLPLKPLHLLRQRLRQPQLVQGQRPQLIYQLSDLPYVTS